MQETNACVSVWLCQRATWQTRDSGFRRVLLYMRPPFLRHVNFPDEPPWPVCPIWSATTPSMPHQLAHRLHKVHASSSSDTCASRMWVGTLPRHDTWLLACVYPQVRQSLGMSPLYVKMIGGRDELSLLQLGEEELSHMTRPTPRRQVGGTSCEGQPHTFTSSIQDALLGSAAGTSVSRRHRWHQSQKGLYDVMMHRTHSDADTSLHRTVSKHAA